MFDDDNYGVGEEQFLDHEFVYRRIRPNHLIDDQLDDSHWPSAQWEVGLSCNWSAVATPEETAGNQPGWVLVIPVGACRQLGIRIVYAPVTNPASDNYNLAHCLLIAPFGCLGKSNKRKLSELRDQLREFCKLKFVDWSM